METEVRFEGHSQSIIMNQQSGTADDINVSLTLSEPESVLTFATATKTSKETNFERTKIISEETITGSHYPSSTQADTEELYANAATQSSPVLFEGNTESGTTVTARFPHTKTVSIFRASGSQPLSQNYPALPQTSTTISATSPTYRGTTEVFTIMSPIHEEFAGIHVIDDGCSQASVSDTDSIALRQRSVQSTSSPTDRTCSQPLRVSEQHNSPSTSQRDAESINAHIVADPRQVLRAGRPARAGQMAAALLLSAPLFSYNSPHRITNCWLESCMGPTMSSDGSTVACPRCKDHSYVRYCSSTHLLSDVREHYINHCGRRANLLAVDESDMTPIRMSVLKFIPVAQDIHDSVERHRQALYHAYPPQSEKCSRPTRPLPDYYVFSDADRFSATGLEVTIGNLYAYRGTGSIAGSVRHNQTDPRKGLFRDLLERLLLLGVSAGSEKPAGCRLLFVWIKENLQDQNEWTEMMITRLCLAMQLEFGWRVDEEVRI